MMMMTTTTTTTMMMMMMMTTTTTMMIVVVVAAAAAVIYYYYFSSCIISVTIIIIISFISLKYEIYPKPLGWSAVVELDFTRIFCRETFICEHEPGVKSIITSSSSFFFSFFFFLFLHSTLVLSVSIIAAGKVRLRLAGTYQVSSSA